MFTRRHFGKTLGGSVISAAGVTTASAQTPAAPSCQRTRNFGSWTARSFVGRDSEGKLESYGSLRVTPTATNITLPGTKEVPYSKGHIAVYQNQESGRFNLSLYMPIPKLTDGGRLGKDYLFGRSTKVEFYSGGRLVATVENWERFFRTFTDVRGFLDSIKGNRDLVLKMKVDSKQISTARYDITGLSQGMQEYASVKRMHFNELRSYERRTGDQTVCKSTGKGGCVMTTASVQMLGRDDDCFELTQMRRLRAAFPQYGHIVKDYVATSNRLLSGPRGVGFNMLLLLFWLSVVLPAAGLVRLGALRAGGYYYLGGFTLLKGLLRRRLNARPDPQITP